MPDLDSKIEEMLIGSFHVWKPLDQKDTSKAPAGIQWFRPNNGELWFFDIDHSAIRTLITTESIQLLERLKEKSWRVPLIGPELQADVVEVADINDELTKLREGL